MKKLVLFALTLSLTTFSSCLVVSCAHLQPGADPIVVRTEQTETSAKASFDLVLKLDNSNRALSESAPQFHAFCEWLRQPQVVEVTNTLPRASALLLSLDDVKEAYIASGASSNALEEAIETVTAAANQASSYSLLFTNLIK